jgi:hypothetical protein
LADDGLRLSLNNDSRATGRDQKHSVPLAEHFVVDINADHGIRSQFPGLFRQFVQGNLPGLAKLILIRARPAPTMSRTLANKSLNMLAPSTASPATTPQYLVIFLLSNEGVVVVSILEPSGNYL